MSKREPGIRTPEFISPRPMLKNLSDAAILSLFGMTREDLYNEIRTAYENKHKLKNCDPGQFMVQAAADLINQKT